MSVRLAPAAAIAAVLLVAGCKDSTSISHAPAMTDLHVHDVNVRILGDVAIVHARTTFTHPDGTPGSGRYTDVWARRNGHWLAVAAQFSRR